MANSYPALSFFPATAPVTGPIRALSDQATGAKVTLTGTDFRARIEVSNASAEGSRAPHLFVPPEDSWDTAATVVPQDPPTDLMGPCGYIRIVLEKGTLTGGNIAESRTHGNMYGTPPQLRQELLGIVQEGSGHLLVTPEQFATVERAGQAVPLLDGKLEEVDRTVADIKRDTAQSGADALAMGAEALQRADGTKTYRYDAEREADTSQPEGTNSYTIESRTNHTRTAETWVLVGSAVASAAEVLSASHAAAWGARTAERAAPRLSVNVCPLPLTLSDYEPDFLRLRADFGNEYGRIPVYLNYVDPDKTGNINWPYTDPFLHAHAASGLSPLLTILMNVHERQYTRPTPQQFARVIDQFITRYAPGSPWYAAQGVQSPAKLVLQIWNEQDAPGFWGGEPNAAEYAALLRACAEVVRRRAMPGVIIITGGVTPQGVDWLAQMFAADPGVAQLIDGVGVHPYAIGQSWPSKAGPSSEWGGLNLLRAVRATVDQYDAGLPLWATEAGFSVLQTGFAAETVRPDEQADYLIRMVEVIREHPELRVELLNLFADRDTPGDVGWGLRDANDVPRPAYRKLSDYLRQRGNILRPGVNTARLHNSAALRLAGANLRTTPPATIEGTMRGTRNDYGPALMADQPGAAPVIPFAPSGSFTLVTWVQLPSDLSAALGVLGLRQADGSPSGTLSVNNRGILIDLTGNIGLSLAGERSLVLQPGEHVAIGLRWDAATHQAMIAVGSRTRGMQTAASMFPADAPPATTHVVPGAIFNRSDMLFRGSINAVLGYTQSLSLRELEALLTGEPPAGDGYALAAPPAGGSWERGAVIASVVAGQTPWTPARFVCTAPGTPGTWAERFDMSIASLRVDAFTLAPGAYKDWTVGAPGCKPGSWVGPTWAGKDLGGGNISEAEFLHSDLVVSAFAATNGVNMRVKNMGSQTAEVPAGFFRAAYT